MKKNVRSKLMPFLCALAYCFIFVFLSASVLFGLWKEFAQMCACAAGCFFCLGAYIFLFESIKRQDKFQPSQGATVGNAQQQAIQVLNGVSLAADRLTVSSDTTLEIPLKNGIIRIQRVEGFENEQLMITSNNSKLFRRMWIYPLTSDAIVVEIK